MTIGRFGACAVLVGLVAGCGEGRAILNIDILSFYPAGVLDTAYTVAGGTAGSIELDPIVVSTIELGGSTIDTVLVTVVAELTNTQGSGTLAFEIYFSDALGALFDPANLVAADTAAVTGVETVSVAPPPFLADNPSIFATDLLYVGVRLFAQADAGPALAGRLRFQQLGARIVVQDELTP
jgi:hypothetical protein